MDTADAPASASEARHDRHVAGERPEQLVVRGLHPPRSVLRRQLVAPHRPGGAREDAADGRVPPRRLLSLVQVRRQPRQWLFVAVGVFLLWWLVPAHDFDGPVLVALSPQHGLHIGALAGLALAAAIVAAAWPRVERRHGPPPRPRRAAAGVIAGVLVLIMLAL